MSWQVGLYVGRRLDPAGRVRDRGDLHPAVEALQRLPGHRRDRPFLPALSLIGFLRLRRREQRVFAPRRVQPRVDARSGARRPSTAKRPSGPPQAARLVGQCRLGDPGGRGRRRPRQTAGAAAAKPDLAVPLGVAIDNLSVIMFLMVTFIATLIHIYSMGYMHDDPRYPRFFAYLSLFCFSMLGLVASSNVFMIFIFWELVGVCSYLLIGFWYEEKVNCDAANKAFIVNRVGDVGMLVGLGLLWTSLGTFNFQEINHGLRGAHGRAESRHAAQAEARSSQLVDPDDATRSRRTTSTGQPRQIPFWMLTLAGLGIFAGCVGKSAQFPLHVWLPDAMAGPTPVSALIHAATMVAAGVYLVGRFFPLFTGDVLLYIAYTGGITLFIAATIAMVQTDYKKVLAYSTVSQLGFMMLGLGVGGWAAGLFHLLTHAFFKALLVPGRRQRLPQRPHL